MYKKLFLFSLVVLWGLSQGHVARGGSLIARWMCDEGQGATVSDSSGNKHNGKFVNGDPAWTTGHTGGAVRLVGPTIVEVPSINMTLSEATIAGWFLPTGAQNDWAAMIMHRGSGSAHGFNFLADRHLAYHWNDDSATWGYRGTAYYSATEWTHCAITVQSTKATFYVNGVSASVNAIHHNPATWNQVLHLGGDDPASWAGRQMNGALDDVIFYSRALTPDQVAGLMTGVLPVYTKAEKPTPADGATGVMIPLMSWTPGETATFDEVYLGTTPSLTAANKVSRQSSMVKVYYAMMLVPGQKYYWRVDSLDAKAKLIATGDVWSFAVAPVIAWDPIPPDGAQYEKVDVDLAWTAGQYAMTHDIYFGTNRDDVNSAAESVHVGSQVLTGLQLPTLLPATTYYWRVDETDQTGNQQIGNLWSFTTRPVIAKTADLMGWWKMEDENSGTVVDSSGWDNDGTIYGNPQWVDGAQGEALQFDGEADYVDTGYATDLANWTVCTWVTSPLAPAATAATGPVHREKNFQINWNHGTAEDRGAAGLCIAGTWYFATFGNLSGNTWYHLAATYDGSALKTYVNGELMATNVSPKGPADSEAATLVFGKHATAAQFFAGAVDDVRLYDRALTADEVKQTMRGDPLVAWDPQPMSGFTVDIRNVDTLSWSAGDGAAKHDVYLGADKAAVKAADTSAPEYRGRQAGTSFSTAGLVQFGGGAYFWRVDEVEADGTTIHKGNVWSFMVPDYLLVDDFESYSDEDVGRIFQTWIDGWGYTTPAPGDPGNGTGATVGYINAPFAERTTVHGGRQSMPFAYDNSASPFYSETVRTFDSPQNWTVSGVTTLSLWVHGYPDVNTVAVTETGGKMSLTGSGADIWGTSDSFTYAYKTLSGDGTIIAKVTSIGPGTNTWAKGGVMIRDSVNGDAASAQMVLSANSDGTAGNGAVFQDRASTGLDMGANDATSNFAVTGPTAPPYWVKIERPVIRSRALYRPMDPPGPSWAPRTSS